MPEGCASRRLDRMLRERRLHQVRFRRRELELGERHDLAVGEVRTPIGEPELVGGAPVGALGGADRDPLEGPGELAAVGVGVHPHCSADGARDVDPELEPGEAPAGRLRGGRGQAHAGPQRRRSPSRSIRASSPSSLRTSPRNPSSDTRRFDPEPTTPTAAPSDFASARSAISSASRARAREHVRRSAGPNRGQAREVEVAFDHRFRRALIRSPLHQPLAEPEHVARPEGDEHVARRGAGRRAVARPGRCRRATRPAGPEPRRRRPRPRRGR